MPKIHEAQRKDETYIQPAGPAGRSTVEPLPGPSRRLNGMGPILVLFAAGLLTALTWIAAISTIQAQKSEIYARAESEAVNKALVFEEQLRRQILAIDQSLRVLELQWQRDPEHFDFDAWSSQMVSVADSSLQMFIADDKGIVRASSRPEIVGNDVSNRDYFRYEANLPADDGRMFISTITQGLITRQWQINMVRRLDRRGSIFAGVISASYDPASLARFYGGIDLGANGLIAVLSIVDGGLRALVGPIPAAPDATVAGSPMFAAMMASPNGLWTGPSAPDGIRRIHAFRRVPDRDFVILVGIEEDDAMAASTLWQRSVMLFAGGITALLLLLTWFLLREFLAAGRREAMLAQDRSALAQSNAWAQAKTAQIEATLAGMTDGVMMLDSDLRLLEWNQLFPSCIGINPTMLRVGLPMAEIIRAQARSGEFGPVDVESEVARRLQALRDGTAVGTIERSRPDGRVLELRRKPMAGGGFVTLYTDITDRRQTEERMRQAETMASIGRLTSGVAHDFNNLLASITGNAELLQRALSDDPQLRRQIDIVVQSASRGAALVRQLLAFSRQQSLAPAAIDLNAAVRGMDELLRTLLGSDMRLATRLQPDLWPALVDPIQIEHVILNLAINARDAMPQGGVLTISTEHAVLEKPVSPGSGDGMATSGLAAGHYIVVSVSDDGSGIGDDVLRHVFEPFFTTKAPGKGSGLGLSQVYGVASQSGGGVLINSAVGNGTTVKVYFPRVMASATAPKPADASTPTQPRPMPAAGELLTVLLVDDDESVRETVAAMLTAGGYEVSQAEDARVALQKLDRGGRFDLLLADFAMPEMNGAELAKAARDRQPGLAVVLMTGYRDEDRISGERWVLGKPFRMSELEAMLSEVLAAANSEPLSPVG